MCVDECLCVVNVCVGVNVYLHVSVVGAVCFCVGVGKYLFIHWFFFCLMVSQTFTCYSVPKPSL